LRRFCSLSRRRRPMRRVLLPRRVVALLRLRLRISFLSASSSHCGCLSPWTWFLMHVPPRFHKLGENVHIACAMNVAWTLQEFALFCFPKPPIATGLCGSHTTCLSAWHTTMSYISCSVLASLFFRTFRSRLQPLVQTRLTPGSSEPRGTQTGVQSSLWRIQTPSKFSVLRT